MKELQIFKNSEFGELGVLTIGGKEYFPATACAKVLGYSNARDAIKRHCKTEGVVKHDAWVQTGIKADGTPAMRKNEIKHINEGNLYRLIVSSKLPTAKKFERWVFDEVLPTIRKTGSYSAKSFEISTELIAIIGKTVELTIKSTIQELLPYLIPSNQKKEDNDTTNVETTKSMLIPQTKIEAFPQKVRTGIDEMLLDMLERQALNYSQIARWCAVQGCPISSPTVKAYFVKHFSEA